MCFSNHLWITGHPVNWIVLFGDMFLLLSVCFSPHLPHLSFRIILQLWFAVKLQKTFMDFETSPDFLSAWRWGQSDLTFTFGWTVPLRVTSLTEWVDQISNKPMKQSHWSEKINFYPPLWMWVLLAGMSAAVTRESTDSAEVCVLVAGPLEREYKDWLDC